MYWRILDGIVLPENFSTQIQASCTLVAKVDIKLFIRSDDWSGGCVTVFLMNTGRVGRLLEDLFIPEDLPV
jgi:hypothetical protein